MRIKTLQIIGLAILGITLFVDSSPARTRPSGACAKLHNYCLVKLGLDIRGLQNRDRTTGAPIDDRLAACIQARIQAGTTVTGFSQGALDFCGKDLEVRLNRFAAHKRDSDTAPGQYKAEIQEKHKELLGNAMGSKDAQIVTLQRRLVKAERVLRRAQKNGRGSAVATRAQASVERYKRQLELLKSSKEARFVAAASDEAPASAAKE